MSTAMNATQTYTLLMQLSLQSMILLNVAVCVWGRLQVLRQFALHNVAKLLTDLEIIIRKANQQILLLTGDEGTSHLAPDGGPQVWCSSVAEYGFTTWKAGVRFLRTASCLIQ